MRYLIRSVKYLLAFCVIYLAVVWLSLKTTRGMDVSVMDYVVATLQTTRGQLLMAAVVVLSALYPRFGFMTRRVECDMEEEKDVIIAAFARAGFSLKGESDGRMVFRATNVLDRIVMLLESNPTLKLEFASHTDSRGTYEYNDELSWQRAKSVVDYLVQAGIAKDRLTWRGYGKRYPIIKNAVTEGEHRLNRRTTFIITDK